MVKSFATRDSHRSAVMTWRWWLFSVAAMSLAPAIGSPRTAQASSPEKALRFGVMAEEAREPDHVLSVFEPFIKLLRSRLLPHRIRVPEMLVARDIEDLSQRVRQGEVDLVLETVFPSLLLKERSSSLEPRMVVVRAGQREYRSVFFTTKEASIQKLADLQGRTLVLQALRSTSAFAVPKAELAARGIRLLPNDDPRPDAKAVRYVLASSEVNQAVWVLHGRGAAGAFNEGDWQALPQAVRSQLRVFHETRPLLRALLSMRTQVDPAVRARAEEVLLHFDGDAEGRDVLAKTTAITRFERLTPSDRDGLRQWEAVLRGAGGNP